MTEGPEYKQVEKPLLDQLTQMGWTHLRELVDYVLVRVRTLASVRTRAASAMREVDGDGDAYGREDDDSDDDREHGRGRGAAPAKNRLERRRGVAVGRKDQPTHQVHQRAEATEDRQNGDEDAPQDGVGVRGAPDRATDAGDEPALRRADETGAPGEGGERGWFGRRRTRAGLARGSGRLELTLVGHI